MLYGGNFIILFMKGVVFFVYLEYYIFRFLYIFFERVVFDKNKKEF